MRYLMITDDGKNIDRRILLQAKALIEKNMDVIILARHEEGLPTSELLDGVRVERVALNSEAHIYRRLSRMARFSNYIVKNIIKSTIAQPLIYKFIKKLNALVGLVDSNNGKHLNTIWQDSSIPLRRKAYIYTKYRFSLVVAVPLYIVFKVFYKPARILANYLSKKIANGGGYNVWETSMAARAVVYNPDVVQANDLPQLAAAELVQSQLGCSIIYDAHEVYTEISSLSREQVGLLESREERVLPKCSARIAVNPYSCDWFLKKYGSQFDCITNATIPPIEFDHKKRYNKFREIFAINESDFILLYQGWMPSTGRGLLELINAVEKGPSNVKLVMMGYGDRAFFHDVIEERKLQQSVFLAEAVEWNELLYWTASADAGVIPYPGIDFNHTYCSPNKLYEFIAAQLPIIGNDLPYLRDVIKGEGFGVMANFDDQDSISKEILEFCSFDSPSFCRAVQNLNDSSGKWLWPEQENKYIDIVNRVIQSDLKLSFSDIAPLPEPHSTSFHNRIVAEQYTLRGKG